LPGISDVRQLPVKGQEQRGNALAKWQYTLTLLKLKWPSTFPAPGAKLPDGLLIASVKVNFVVKEKVLVADVQKLMARLQLNTRQYFGQWELMPTKKGGPYSNGILLNFQFNYAIYAPNPDAYDVQIVIDPSEPRDKTGLIPKTGSRTWYIRDPNFTNPGSVLGIHEIGHLFGLPDEYVGPNSKYQSQVNLPPDAAKGFMGAADPRVDGYFPRYIIAIILDNGLQGNQLKGWIPGGPYYLKKLPPYNIYKNGKQIPSGNIIPIMK
jgi:hypothetical protein